MSTQTNIAAILAMAPGPKGKPNWINGSFEANVWHSEQRGPFQNGRYAYTADLYDPYDQTKMIQAIGDFDLRQFEGCHVKIDGKGRSRGDYNGVPQCKMGQHATVELLAGTPKQVSTPAPTPPPAAPSAPPPPPGPGPSAPAGAGPVSGQAIGNAITNAVVVALHNGEGLDKANFAKTIWTIASDLLRVSERLNAGKLAGREETGAPAAPAQPAAPSAPPPPAPPPPPPGPGGQAFTPEQEVEDDIPF